MNEDALEVKQKGRVRFSVDLPVKIYDDLEELTRLKGIKKSDLLRGAIKLALGLQKYSVDGNLTILTSEGEKIIYDSGIL